MGEHECTCRNCGGREHCKNRFEPSRKCCCFWEPELKPIFIPCSERLPEIGVPVLTYDGQFYSIERRIEYIDTDDGPLYGNWWIDGYEGDESYPYALRDEAPTHWIPLPKPLEKE